MTTGSDSNDEQRPRDPLGLDDDTEPAAAPEAAPAPAGPAAAPSAAPPRPRGRLLAGLALLLALTALGGAGYLYWELIERSDVRTLAPRLEALRDEVRAETSAMSARFEAQLERDLQAGLQRLAVRQQEALAEFRERQAAALEATESALRESVAEIARQAPPSSAEWRRAEVQYLLRIANHRLLMERDVSGALRLLHTADAVLAELDDFSLHEVRARLSDEIAALEAVEGIDLQGLFLRLEAAKRDLQRLPLRVPEYTGTESPPPDGGPADEGIWPALQRQLAGLLRVRRLEGDVRPLLAPEQAVYLELNLRLMLERAQLAAVRRQQLVFEESLATAEAWIRRYLNVDEPSVGRLLEEIAALQAVDLEQPLPDVSGSLNALHEVLRAAP